MHPQATARDNGMGKRWEGHLGGSECGGSPGDGIPWDQEEEPSPGSTGWGALAREGPGRAPGGRTHHILNSSHPHAPRGQGCSGCQAGRRGPSLGEAGGRRARHSEPPAFLFKCLQRGPGRGHGRSAYRSHGIRIQTGFAISLA